MSNKKHKRPERSSRKIRFGKNSWKLNKNTLLKGFPDAKFWTNGMNSRAPPTPSATRTKINPSVLLEALYKCFHSVQFRMIRWETVKQVKCLPVHSLH